MYKICRSKESNQRQRLLEQTLFQMMKTQPYTEITVSELCRKAEIPRKAFYRYFDTKEDVLNALLDHANEETMYADLTDFESMDRIEYNFTYWVRNKELMDVLIRNNLEGIMVARAMKQIINERLAMQATVQNATEEERIITTIFAASGILNLILYFHREGWKHTPKEMAQLVRKMLVMPLYRDE